MVDALGFLNVDVHNSLKAAIVELILKKPKHQSYFIADFIDRCASALVKVEVPAIVASDAEKTPTQPIEDDDSVRVVNSINSFAALLDTVSACKPNGKIEMEPALREFASQLVRLVPGATSSYLGKRISFDNIMHVEYLSVWFTSNQYLGRADQPVASLPPLPESKGVTWRLWLSDSPETPNPVSATPTHLYIENVLFDNDVEFLVSYPRSGSLFLIGVGDYVIGVDTVGSGETSIDEALRDFFIYLVSELISSSENIPVGVAQ